MKNILTAVMALLCMTGFASCEKEQMNSIPYHLSHEPLPSQAGAELAVLDLSKAIALTDTAVNRYFTGANMTMQRYYNPYTKSASAEVGSVWMYTSAIEAVNSVMESLKTNEKLAPKLYADNFARYEELLTKLYAGLEHYAGTTTITSYTQTKKWTVYAVNRADVAGGANADGINNVYDDQEWLIREMVRSYLITGNGEYLAKAEYLTDYVLDGWDCTINANGEENGGITWGPGYVTKHSCSNGPLVSPLVWLYEIYRGKTDLITYRKIDLNGHRYEVTAKKSGYYLDYAKKIYEWQKKYLQMDNGVYFDLIGANGNSPQYEQVEGNTYRKGLALTTPSGTAYTYNSGAMLSGGADLYRVTRLGTFLSDTENLAKASFSVFADKDAAVPGYYSYPIEGFSTWFNDVLMRGYIAACKQSQTARDALDSFQHNLDYGWANYLHGGLLPTNLLVGWSRTLANNQVEGMFAFAFASEYAMLANYQCQVHEE